MAMTSMKRTKAELKLREAMNQPVAATVDEPVYPWGLEINLENDAMEKLGWEPKDYKVGDTMELVIRVEVRSMSENKSTSGARKAMCLQITDIGLAE